MTKLDGAKVLVTGAGGFIGSHLVEQLVSTGANVRALLRYDSQNRLGHLSALPDTVRASVEIVRGDLKDPEAVHEAVRGCDTVFHLGALIAIPFSYQNPTDYVQTNVLGTLHVLNACRAAGVRRLIHTSTSEVYGSAQHIPITLDHPRHGQSPYAASKIGADALVESFHRSFGLDVVTVRPFNTYGPRQSPRAVIPAIIRQALTGEVIRLGSTTPTRDFLYVADTAAGFVAAAAAPASASGHEVQLGTGVETSIQNVVAIVGELLDKKLRVVQQDERVRPEASEVNRLLCDASSAHNLLGWNHEITLRDGLARVIEWLKTKSITTPEQYVV